jgi:hypothetical protein
MRRDRLVSLMERLDPEYSAFKKASNDKAKSAEARAVAAESFKKREADLMPTYKQIALLFADLHEYVGQHGHAQYLGWFANLSVPVAPVVWRQRVVPSQCHGRTLVAPSTGPFALNRRFRGIFRISTMHHLTSLTLPLSARS